MQEEARAKYGLTAEQIKEAEEQVDELIAEAQATVGANQEDVALLSKSRKKGILLSMILSHLLQYSI